jgi:hypothetical protein
MNTRWPRPDPGVPTELVIGSDGVLYFTAVGRDPARFIGRCMFVGRALCRAELVELGVRGVLVRAALGRLAVGSDGRVYGAPGEAWVRRK